LAHNPDPDRASPTTIDPGDSAAPGAGVGSMLCPRCEGSGYVDRSLCPDCGGTGQVTRRTPAPADFFAEEGPMPTLRGMSDEVTAEESGPSGGFREGPKAEGA